MKRSVLFVIAFLIFLIPFSSAAICILKASVINQDPYPAMPGEYVDVVFQLTGVDNPECKTVDFKVIEAYPFTLDPGAQTTYTIQGGNYLTDYQSYLLAPYKIRVDSHAIGGDIPVEVNYRSRIGMGDEGYLTEKFNINVEDLTTDFEVSIKDYVPSTNEMTFEILNIGEHDIEALTIEIPKQDNIEVKGGNRKVIGSLDSNEDTTFSFEAIPQSGKIKLNIYYTDTIKERRSTEKTTSYDESYFTDRNGDDKESLFPMYIIGLLIAGGIFWWHRRMLKKRKEKITHFSHQTH
jgi:hypothetical protein